MFYKVMALQVETSSMVSHINICVKFYVVIGFFFLPDMCTMGRDSAVGIATRYRLDGPGIESRWQARFSAHVQTGPGAHLASCTMSNASFSGVKRPRRSTDHPSPSKFRGQERVGLYLYSPSGPSWLLWENLYLFTLYVYKRTVCVAVHTKFYQNPSFGSEISKALHNP